MKLLRWHSELALPAKITIGSIFSIAAGPGLIAFISEYATYFYALDKGIRPPVEGVPYLYATVALMSLAIAVVACVVF